jgi:homocysteine S-methyltransferase
MPCGRPGCWPTIRRRSARCISITIGPGRTVAPAPAYQATVRRLYGARHVARRRRGHLIRLSVTPGGRSPRRILGRRAKPARRLRPLVAASVGPYGAYLADGSEYRGDYDLDERGLVRLSSASGGRFWPLSGPTSSPARPFPSFAEARALADLLAESDDAWAWFSFSCRDGAAYPVTARPSPTVRPFWQRSSRVAAVGINCTPPRLIPDLIRAVAAVTDKPVIVYPNSGESYDP